jgi:microcin C transport system ATP-binding protein
VVVLREGKIVEEGTAHEIFTHPREAYTRALMQAAFDLDTEPTPPL